MRVQHDQAIVWSIERNTNRPSMNEFVDRTNRPPNQLFRYNYFARPTKHRSRHSGALILLTQLSILLSSDPYKKFAMAEEKLKQKNKHYALKLTMVRCLNTPCTYKNIPTIQFYLVPAIIDFFFFLKR